MLDYVEKWLESDRVFFCLFVFVCLLFVCWGFVFSEIICHLSHAPSSVSVSGLDICNESGMVLQIEN